MPPSYDLSQGSLPRISPKRARGEDASAGLDTESSPPDLDGDDDEGEEIEELNPDGGSREATSELSSLRAKRDAGRKARTRKLARKPSGSEFLDRPSERWELGRWRTRSEEGKVQLRGGTDLVGYWACRRREVLGAEDPDLRFPDVASDSFRRVARNVRLWVQRFLDGVESRYVEAVELALQRDPEATLVRLFGRPSTDAAWRELAGAAPKRRNGRRAESPIERDSRYGVDDEYWRKQAREARRRRETRDSSGLGAPDA